MAFDLQALEAPPEGSVHPQAAELREYGRAWVQRVGLVQTTAELARFDAALFWQLIAQSYPEAPWEILTIAHDWSCWGFFLDDFDDSSEAAIQPAALQRFFVQLLAILRDEPLPGERPLLCQVVEDIWKRVHRYSSSEWRHRFASTLSESLAAYQWEAQNRVSRRIPSLVEYIEYRRKTGGWRTLVLIVDLALGRTLPQGTYSNPVLQQLLDTANNAICWANDLFSFEKERARGDVHNLITVTQAEHQCPLETAVQLIIGWHNQELQRWQYLVTQLPRWSWKPYEIKHIQAYATFSKNYLHANYVWSQVTGRYQSHAAL
ncbi:MAG TPA: terpene synthase family protein [Ktedonobacterales bacterium]